MSKISKIILSISSVFVLAIALIFPMFNSSIVASAETVSSDSIVDSSNTNFYNNYYLLEYISSSGSAYIDTGFLPSSNTSVDVDFVGLSSGTDCLFGSRTKSGSTYNKMFSFYNSFQSSILSKAVRISSNFKNFSSSISNLNVRSRLVMNSSSCVLSFSSQSITSTFSSTSFTTSTSLYIFSCHSSDSGVVDNASFRIYSFKIYDSGSLVRNFVPARQKISDDIGLYDLVNNRFYKSPNGISFTSGPRIYSVNFYNGSTLYNTQNFTSISDFILPTNPIVNPGYSFVGWSLVNDNDINSIVNPYSLLDTYSALLNFYSVVVSDDYLAGYNNAKNIYDGFGPFLYSNYAFVEGNGIDSFTAISSLTGRVSSPDFIGYGGGVVLSDSLWSRVDEYEYNNEIDTSLIFTFDTPIPVAKYTNFMFNGNFQYGNSAIFYFNDSTSYTFSSDMGLGNFVDLTSYNTKFITRIRLTYASSIGDYGQGIGLASNPSYLDSYNNGYTEGRNFGYNNGYSNGYRDGNNTGYNKGYNEGLANGSDYSFFGLFGAVLDAPISALKGLLNFQIFGVNLLTLFTGLLTLAIILLVLKLMRGGK